MKKLTAVIPVRKGSKRVKNKSTREFSDTTLIDYKIETLKQVEGIDEIVVATDCQICIDKAISHNVSYKIRDGQYVNSGCSASGYFKSLADIIDTDYFMYSPSTSPFISVDSYNNFIETFKEKIIFGYDSLTVVNRISCHTWYKNEPLNYSLNEQVNSQDLPKIDLIGYCLSLVIKDSMFKTLNVIGEVPDFYPLGLIESWDINEMEEFIVAKCIYDNLIIRKN